MASLSSILIAQWYEPKLWGWLLWPFSQLFNLAVQLRSWCYKYKLFSSYKAAVPVIVVGNISVGGTGKTPLVIYLAQYLQQQGYKPGIVAHGYKSKLKQPTIVTANSQPSLVGDEAVLLAKRCNCPVVVAKKRINAVKLLENDLGVNVIISDDGLQHYALARDLEIAVIDQARGFGNGYTLPMGPLRELPKRLKTVDLAVFNGQDMLLQQERVYSLLQPKHSVDINFFSGRTVHAIAAIGNPQRFFKQLQCSGLNVIAHEFPDHYAFKAEDITFVDAMPVLMTEKDAVKCNEIGNLQHWVVAVAAYLQPQTEQKLGTLIAGVLHGR